MSPGLWPTFVVGGTQVVASSALTPLIPLYVVARGGSPAVVGLVAASTAVLPMLLAVWTGVAVDVVGTRRMSILAALVLTAATTLIAGAPTIPLLMVGTAIAGMATNALILATQTSVAHASRPDNRNHNFGYFAFWVSAGQLVGPVLGGGLAEASSIQAALYACAGMSLVPGVAALWLPRSSAGATREDDLPRGLRAREVYGSAWRLAKRRDLQFVMLVAFVIVFSWSIKSSFYPLYLKMVGLPTSLIGAIFSILGAGSMLVRPLVGTIAARYGVQRVLMGAVAAATVAIGVTPLLRHFWPLALAALTTGMAWGFTQPLTMSLIAGGVAPAERGLALSLRMTSNRLAEVVSPIAFGGMIALAGLGSAFFLSAGVLALGLVIIAQFAGAAPPAALRAVRNGTEAPVPQATATGSPRERPAPASPDRG